MFIRKCPLQVLRKMFCSILPVMILFAACQSPQQDPGANKTTEKPVKDTVTPGDTVYKTSDTVQTPKSPAMSPLEQSIRDAGLVNVQEENPQIQVKLRYSGTRNFLGIDIYGALTQAYLQPMAARKLARAQHYLDSLKPGYKLLVWDAVRPISAQQMLWDSINKPDSLKHLYVAPPGRHSLHNYGCAADVTLLDSTGRQLDMGTDFDHFGIKAYPRKEAYCLRNQLLKPEHIVHRETLREVMQKGGFSPITTEWWHFNACSRKYAKAHYEPVP